MTSLPWSLVFAYAFFRVFEYFSLRSYRELYAERQFAAGLHTKPLAVMGAVLLPARIAGWGILLWAAVKFGILPTVAMVAVAFVLSIALQVTVASFFWNILGGVAPVAFLAAVPLMVVLIAVIMAGAGAPH